ncbi:O-methyltransferase, partial [Acetobacter sp. TBRC 12305]|nr:O-methyltransferase [Acetobacter garciniae]MBX0346398.1 O-methyltransferase [Acetobacter garciniae]
MTPDKAPILRSSPVAPLLDRLFAEADAATSPAISNLAPEELQRLVGSRDDYVQFYGLAKDLWLPVSRETGRLLYMLARTMKAQHIMEFGTSFGISTIHLAAALRDNGGGRLITTEFEPSKIVRARQH